MIRDFLGITITEVYVTNSDKDSSNFDEFILKIEHQFMVISVDTNSDEIKIKMENDIQDKDIISVVWSDKIIGKKIAGVWEKENQNGYFDFLAIGLDYFIPVLCITSIASELKIGFINYENA